MFILANLGAIATASAKMKDTFPCFNSNKPDLFASTTFLNAYVDVMPYNKDEQKADLLPEFIVGYEHADADNKTMQMQVCSSPVVR